ncbi:MAG: hypothetical protein ACRD2T_04650 [Thermoanaerobaculia bacterium]
MPVTQGTAPTRARLALWLLLLLGASAATAQSGQTLFEDGEFTGWVTTVLFPEDGLVSGARQPAGGNPGAHYLVTHTQRETDSAGFGISSLSVYQGQSFDLPPGQPGARLECQLDIRAEDPQPVFPQFPPMLHWSPVIVQSGRTFTAQDLVSGPLPAAFRTDRLVVPRNRFRARDGSEPLNPDFSASAPPIQLGLALQTQVIVNGNVADTRTIRVRIDNFRVRLLPQAAELTFELTDRGQAWADQVGETIGYHVTVENAGPPRAGLVVEVIVPNNTCFSREGSTAGWVCGADMSRACSVEGDGLCTYDLGALATGESVELSFTVSLQAGVPAEWEFLAEARLLSPNGDELASEDEITPPVALTGPGCLCLFQPSICTGE